MQTLRRRLRRGIEIEHFKQRSAVLDTEWMQRDMFRFSVAVSTVV
ncbi:protein of unknown function (plasmid) [Candidatus Methylocalor cossyra]|uniref:Transposase DDE domain-containing protein n=1 Tax=Candidatus Methylocalor cossyra TaxID=3108543 RepID=A0ABP1CCX7_9GAMM